MRRFGASFSSSMFRPGLYLGLFDPCLGLGQGCGIDHGYSELTGCAFGYVEGSGVGHGLIGEWYDKRPEEVWRKL